MDNQPTPVVVQPQPEAVLYEWEAPARLFKKRNREFYTTVAAITILLSIILLLAKEFLLIAVILALMFFAYVLASVEPEKVKHQLTTKGVRSLDKLIFWQEMNRFWWEEKWKQQVLHIQTPFRFPGKLLLVLGEGEREKIEGVVGKYLVKEKPQPTWFDKAADWLKEKIPLETE